MYILMYILMLHSESGGVEVNINNSHYTQF